MTEADLLPRVRLALQQRHPNLRIFRNNQGVAQFPGGERVVYGLCPGSADLVGWLPTLVTTAHVGSTLAVFVAVECKATKGRLTEQQTRWLEQARRDGCIVRVARDDSVTLV